MLGKFRFVYVNLRVFGHCFERGCVISRHEHIEQEALDNL